MTKATWFRVVVIALCACSGGSEPNQPGAHGALRITVQTSGPDQDPDGYSVTVTGVQPHSLAINADWVLTGLEPGTRTVGLSGVASNCSVTGESSRQVTIVAGDTSGVSFAVSCIAVTSLTGAIAISTTTTGSDPDPDGYTVTVDGGMPRAVNATGTVWITSLTAGAHAVALSGFADNCEAADANPKTVQITAGDTTAASFAVSCAVRDGAIRVETVTIGRDQDADGYLVSVDNQAGISVSANGAFVIDGIHAGTHSITFGGFAGNCDILSPEAQTVTVPYADTLVVAATARCLGSLAGRIVFPSACSVEYGGRTTTCGLMSMNPDGSDREMITLQDIAQGFQYPDVSPAGSEIVFIKQDPGQAPTPWLVDALGRNIHALPGNYLALSVRWSPDGGKLALGALDDLTGAAEILIVNADGSNPMAIGPSGRPLSEPSWSPDGTRLVAVAGSDTGSVLAVMNADGSGFAEIPGTGLAVDPGWAPDGSLLAYTSDSHGVNTGNIFVIRPDGTGKTQLSTAGSDTNPRWAPDGQHIAYWSASGTQSRIMIMNADGGMVQPLTGVADVDGPPAWGP